MNYLLRNRSRTSYWKKVVTLVGLFVVGALLFALLGGTIVSTVSPIWRTENGLVRIFRNSFEYWHKKQTLIDENVSLRERVTALEFEKASLTLSLTQEQTLSTLLGRGRREGEVIASVLTRPPQSPYDLFVIDAGESDGITLGSRVSLPEGPLLGVVSDLFSSSAKVRLFTTVGEKTEAVLERGNVPVTLEGRGAGNFRIKVPRETATVIGDKVISADVNYRLLGIVEDIEVSPTDSFKEILVKSPANIFAVRLVSVSP